MPHLRYDQTLLRYIREERFRMSTQPREVPSNNPEPESIGANVEGLREKTEGYLKKLLYKTAKIRPDEINMKEPFQQYGFDSRIAMAINNELEGDFGELPKTLLFEYSTLEELTSYFVENHQEVLRKKFKNEMDKNQRKLAAAETPAVTAAVLESGPDGRQTVPLKESRFARSRFGRTAVPQVTEPAGGNGKVAIIGLSGRYPGADDLDEFWENLKQGKDCITEIPAERWDYRRYYDPDKEKLGKSCSKWGGFINGIDKFDSMFFNISPVEANLVDPQERIFLQTAWHTLEDAGYTKEKLGEYKVGVYVGATFGLYQLFDAEMDGKPVAHINMHSSIANRVSYFLNLHGPSMAIDTMCSSSLTALHLACESIRSGETDMALVGGVNANIHPKRYIHASQSKFFSTEGKCRAFGEGGDGFVIGEGVGAVLVKSLDKAVKDGDHIYGVILSTAINHGGKANGYTVPNPTAQGVMISDALRKAGINPRTLSYIEAHGTGTSLGDPIEIAGLMKAFGEYTSEKQYCSIGSVKANIGHLEPAAGIAGLTKVLLQMKHKKLVPSILSEKLNPAVNFKESAFYVQHAYEDWKQPVILEDGKEKTFPRRAGVSSFGAGGSNGHVIIEEYDHGVKPAQTQYADTSVMVLSAKSEKKLKEYAVNLLRFIEKSETTRREVVVDREGLLQDINHELRNTSAEILQMEYEDIDGEVSVEECGFDPLKFNRLLEAVNAKYGIDLKPSFSNTLTSLVQIASHILDGHSALMEEFYPHRKKERIIGDVQYSVALPDLAYTLQVGREALEHRLAVLVSSVDEFRKKLKEFSEGVKDIENLYTGSTKSSRDKVDLLVEGKEGEEFLKIVVSQGKLDKIAQLWVMGFTIEWKNLYTEGECRRISLPVYPFEEESYWLPNASKEWPQKSSGAAAGKLHPLIGSNTSSMKEQRFSTRFAGSEFYLTDYVLAGNKMLPPAACLEMFRAAAQIWSEKKIVSLRHIVWAGGTAYDRTPEEARIALYPLGDILKCEVRLITGPSVASFSQAEIVLNGEADLAASLDIKGIQSKCSESISGDGFYTKTGGVLSYGKELKAINGLYRTEGQVLAHLILPEALAPDAGEYVLHPALMESVLAAARVLCEEVEPGSLYLPHTMEQISIHGALTGECYVLLSVRQNASKGLSGVLDVVIANAAGKSIATMKGLVLKKESFAYFEAAKAEEEAASTLYYGNSWMKRDAGVGTKPAASGGTVISFESGYSLKNELNSLKKVISVRQGHGFRAVGADAYEIDPAYQEDYIKLFEEIKKQHGKVEAIVHLWQADGDGAVKDELIYGKALKGRLQRGIDSMFYIVNAIVKSRIQWDSRFIAVGNNYAYGPGPFDEAVVGFSRSLKILFPDISFTAIYGEYGNGRSDEGAKAAVLELGVERANAAEEVRYIEGERYVKEYRHIKLDSSIPLKLKEKGTYIITGGIGALGMIFAGFLGERLGARLALVGRSALDGKREKALEKLRDAGYEAVYYQADVGSLEDMEKVVSDVRQRFGSINGVLHTAGIVSDKFIVQKSINDFHNIMKPKINGTLVLDHVTRNDDIELFALFSSTSSILGDFGQCDYAVGNRFLDGYAGYREALRKRSLRKGRTLSINWPLWKEGGMHLGDKTEAAYLASSGMDYLHTENGIKVFEEILASEYNSVMAIVGSKSKIDKVVQITGEKAVKPVELSRGLQDASRASKQVKSVKKAVQGVSQNSVMPLEARVEEELRSVISGLLGIPAEKIDATENFGNFGFDSVSIKAFSDRISSLYTIDIKPMELFDNSSLQSLTAYLLKESEAAVKSYYGAPGAVAAEEVDEAVEEMQEYPEPAVEMTRYGDLESLESRFAASKPFYGTAGSAPGSSKEPVAIIGVSAMLPGSKDLNDFWENLRAQKDLVTEIPSTRWDWKHYYGGDITDKNKVNSKWGSFIEDVDKFDPRFFNITQKEAEFMDPQHRLFLQVSWKAIEDAGYKASALSGKNVGVFAGVQYNDYQDIITGLGEAHAMMGTGNTHCMLPNRVSYLLNLKGPSEAIHTACSSSLVAIHHAVASIQNGESELALAGGISLMLTPSVYVAAGKLGIISSDGRCKTFDKSANGYVKGEGVGVVLLKPLHKAIKDKDYIYAVIKSAAVNHGGKANSLTAPNSAAQADLLIKAYQEAGVDPDTVTHIEAHGTGTELGDPVEIEGLKKAFNELFARKNTAFSGKPYCALGTVKTSIGHLEPAAGVAGIIKVLLAMKNGMIPGILHFKEMNPYIDLKNTPFYIADKTQYWKRLTDSSGKAVPRRAGVSSFGFGGSNSHVVLEEFENDCLERPGEKREERLFILSAKSADRLKEYAVNLLEFLEKHAHVKIEEEGPDSRVSLSSIAYTLQVGREEMSERLAIKSSSFEELKDKLLRFSQGENEIAGLYAGRVQGKKTGKDTQENNNSLQEKVGEALAAGRLEEIAGLWVTGEYIDWKALYGGDVPVRAPLPTYPFAKERYWVEGRLPAHKTVEAPTEETAPDSEKDSLLVEILRQLETGELDIENADQLTEEILNG